MYFAEDLWRSICNISEQALLMSVLLLVFGGIIKWVFYYTIVKAGAKNAIEECMRRQDMQVQSQIAGMRKQLELQQQEIQRLQGQISNRL